MPILPFTLSPPPSSDKLVSSLNRNDQARLIDLVARFLVLAAKNPTAGSLVLSIGDLVLQYFDA